MAAIAWMSMSILKCRAGILPCVNSSTTVLQAFGLVSAVNIGMYFLSIELNGALEPGLLSWAAGWCAELGHLASLRLLAGGQDSTDSLVVKEMSSLLGKVSLRNVDGLNRLKIMT